MLYLGATNWIQPFETLRPEQIISSNIEVAAVGTTPNLLLYFLLTFKICPCWIMSTRRQQRVQLVSMWEVGRTLLLESDGSGPDDSLTCQLCDTIFPSLWFLICGKKNVFKKNFRREFKNCIPSNVTMRTKLKHLIQYQAHGCSISGNYILFHSYLSKPFW